MTKNKSIGKHALENIKYKNNLNVLKHTKIKGKSKNEKQCSIIKLILQYQISTYNVHKYVSLKQNVINLNFYWYPIY